VGEPLAGDDGVGIRLIQRLRGLPGASQVELHALRDPSELAALLSGVERALVIDAVLDPERPGHVELLPLGELTPERGTRRAVSSHGVDTLTAIEIGRALAAGVRFPPVTLLTIAIEPPTRFTAELSPAAQAGLERALELAVAWIWGPQQA
jgi:hydrogenase maturation protease